jgi:hypothetical protein
MTSYQPQASVEHSERRVAAAAQRSRRVQQSPEQRAGVNAARRANMAQETPNQRAARL